MKKMRKIFAVINTGYGTRNEYDIIRSRADYRLL